MALTRRQEILYSDRMNLWEPVKTKNPTTGRTTDKSYVLRQTDVPCYFQVRQSVEGPSVVGRIEGDNMFTRDAIHCDGALDVDSDWVVKNVTLDADGTPSQNYGRFWIVSGHPLSLSNRGKRRARKRHLEAIQLQTPPEDVS